MRPCFVWWTEGGTLAGPSESSGAWPGPDWGAPVLLWGPLGPGSSSAATLGGFLKPRTSKSCPTFTRKRSSVRYMRRDTRQRDYRNKVIKTLNFCSWGHRGLTEVLVFCRTRSIFSSALGQQCSFHQRGRSVRPPVPCAQLTRQGSGTPSRVTDVLGANSSVADERAEIRTRRIAAQRRARTLDLGHRMRSTLDNSYFCSCWRCSLYARPRSRKRAKVRQPPFLFRDRAASPPGP